MGLPSDLGIMAVFDAKDDDVAGVTGVNVELGDGAITVVDLLAVGLLHFRPVMRQRLQSGRFSSHFRCRSLYVSAKQHDESPVMEGAGDFFLYLHSKQPSLERPREVRVCFFFASSVFGSSCLSCTMVMVRLARYNRPLFFLNSRIW